MRFVALAFAAAAVIAAPAGAAEIKVGYISTFSGPDASIGLQMDRGFKLYQKLNPNVPGGHKIELVQRDDTGAQPAIAKRLAEELIARDRVAMLAGFIFTPNAYAVMDVCKQSKVPVLIMNAGTAGVISACEYAARVSFTTWQAGYHMGEYAAKKMGKTAAIAYANYAPGKDYVAAYTEPFEKNGGKILADVPMPFPNIPDFTPFLQKVKDIRPDLLFVFVPAGKWSTGIMKTYNDLDMRKAGVTLIGPGDITQDSELPNMGNVPLGVITIHHYSAAATRPENLAFVKAWKEAYGADTSPDFFGVQGYDGMAAIYHVAQATGGKVDADSFVKAMKGWQHASPRGPMMIDPETRDVVHNEYIRKVEMKDGKLANIEFDTIPMVKDPWKALGKK
jgi:branched-chain amino acid transport system substrate-binding protein